MRHAVLDRTVDDCYPVVEGLEELGEAAIEQNDQVQRIFLWAAILFAPSIIGSVYGMEFRFIPELSWAWGCPMAPGRMLRTGVGLHTVFRCKRWL